MTNALSEAHKHSSYHRKELEQSEFCRCFYCFGHFSTTDIHEWIDDGNTGLCPNCGVDAVLGNASGYTHDEAFLVDLHKHWF